MAKRVNTMYEVHYDGELVCRGSIDDVAEALFVNVDTARRYASTQPRQKLEVVKLPIGYEACDGNLSMLGSCDEIANAIGVTPSYVRQCCRQDVPCVGYSISKHAGDKYMMDALQRVQLLNAKRS